MQVVQEFAAVSLSEATAVYHRPVTHCFLKVVYHLGLRSIKWKHLYVTYPPNSAQCGVALGHFRGRWTAVYPLAGPGDATISKGLLLQHNSAFTPLASRNA
jgi:hypothetical protein